MKNFLFAAVLTLGGSAFAFGGTVTEVSSLTNPVSIGASCSDYTPSFTGMTVSATDGTSCFEGTYGAYGVATFNLDTPTTGFLMVTSYASGGFVSVDTFLGNTAVGSGQINLGEGGALSVGFTNTEAFDRFTINFGFNSAVTTDYQVEAASGAPEPSTFVMMLPIGLAGIGLARRRFAARG